MPGQFYIDPWLPVEHAVLPSFGAFTGVLPVTPKTGERVFVTTGDGVFAVVTRPAA